MKQEGRVLGFEALASEKYDGRRPLENFLYIHIRNRLYNFKRDHFRRSKPPCIECPFFDPKFQKSDNRCTAFIDKMECDKWSKWYKKNETKKNLHELVDLENVDDGSTNYEPRAEDVIHLQELFVKINKELPVALRKDYLQILDDLSKHKGNKKYQYSIPKVRRDKVFDYLKSIIEGFGICQENEED
jgi:hypothetical protein